MESRDHAHTHTAVESGYTPGPWRVAQTKPTKTRGILILAGYAQGVAYVPVPPAYMTEHPEHANARLIAAAPTMREALELIARVDIGEAGRIATDVLRGIDQ